MTPQRWEVIRHPDGSVGVLVTPYRHLDVHGPAQPGPDRRWAITAGETELTDRLSEELLWMAENGWG